MWWYFFWFQFFIKMYWWQYFVDVIQIVATLITAWIAWLVFQSQNQRDEHEKNLQQPHLTIVNMSGLGWVLLNVGQGPALRIRFADKHENWLQPVIGYSIPANSFLWLNPEIHRSEGFHPLVSV